MNIISTITEFKGIQSWSQATLPEGYAWWDDELDSTDFYAYNGCVTLTVENDVVTGYIPNTEVWTPWKTEQPTEEDRASTEVRTQRDALIAETDWTQLGDVDLTAECVAEFVAYRQALRGVPAQEGFPFSVVWPDKPAEVNDAS